MKNAKKVTSVLLAVLFVVNLIAVPGVKFDWFMSASASAVDYDDAITEEGQILKDTFIYYYWNEEAQEIEEREMQWLFDSASGRLTLSGNGGVNYEPWRVSRQLNPARIKEVVFEEGITEVYTMGEYAYPNLERVLINSSVFESQYNSSFTGAENLKYISTPVFPETGISWTYDYTTKTLTLNYDGKGNGFVECEHMLWHGFECIDYASIEHVVVGEGIKAIGFNVFWDHRGMKTLSLPESLYYLDPSNFADTPSLTEVSVDENNETFYTIDGVLYGYERYYHYDGYVDWTNEETGETWRTYSGDMYTWLTEVWVNASEVSDPDNYKPLTSGDECDPRWYTHVDDNGNEHPGLPLDADGTLPDDTSWWGVYEDTDAEGNPNNVYIFYHEQYERLARFVPRNTVGKVTFEKGTSYLASFSCSACPELTAVELPDYCYIGDSVFQYSYNLTDFIGSVYSFDAENRILYEEFYSCDDPENGPELWCMRLILALPSISGHYVVPSKFDVVEISSNAFYGCKYLTEVTIGENVRGIPVGCFEGCTSLEKVNLPENIFKFIEEDENASFAYIGYAAFCNTGLKSIDIPEGVELLPGYSFARCAQLESVNLPETMAHFEERVFEGCTSLKSFTFPERVTDPYGDTPYFWGDFMFSGCTSLESVTLPTHEDNCYLPTAIFEGCTSLESITIPDNILETGGGVFNGSGLKSINTNNINCIGAEDFACCENLTEAIIPNAVIISDRAFADCPALTDVTLNEGLYYIGGSAFSGASSLKEIIFPSTLEEIAAYAFYACGFDTEVVLPEGLVVIGEYAFCDCDFMPAVVIPSTVTYIANWAIVSCDRLETITVSADNENYCSLDGILFSKDMTVLYNYPCLKAGAYVIPDTVETIGVSAFDSCSALTGLTLPEGLTSIDELSFAYCHSLTNMTIPSTMKEIGPAAFMECWALSDVYYYGSDWADVYVDDTHAKEWDGTYNWANYNNDAFWMYSTIHYQVKAEDGYDAKVSTDTTLENGVAIDQVKLEVSEGALDEEFVMQEGNISSDGIYGSGVVIWCAYEFKFTHDSREVEIEEGYATVRAPFPKGINAKNYHNYAIAVYHTVPDGKGGYTVERIEPVADEYGFVFNTRHFSPFTVTAQEIQKTGFSTEVVFESDAHDSIAAAYTIDNRSDVLNYGVAILDESYFSAYKAMSPQNFLDNRNSIKFTTADGTLVYDEEAGYYKADPTKAEGYDASATYYYLAYAQLANGQYAFINDFNFYVNDALEKIDVLEAGKITLPPEEVDYDIIPNINGGASKLYEPWGLRYFAVYAGNDAGKVKDRGIAILKDKYYTEGMTGEEFAANENAFVYLDSKGELGFEEPSTNNPDGRYYATLTEGIYSYDISANYYVVPFAVMENGQTVYGTIKSNSMEKILDTNLGLSSISETEKAICNCILDLKDSVAAHYAASGVPGASIDMNIPRGDSQTAAAKIMSADTAKVTPNVVAGASRLIEPWGLRYFAMYDGVNVADIADRGMVILSDKYYNASYDSNQDAMRLNTNAYVFNESNGTLAYDESGARWYGTVTEGISSKDIADVYYVVPFVVLNDGSYVYGMVKSNSMLNIMNTNLGIDSIPKTEKAVTVDIIDLYEAVKAYYAA